MTALARAEAIKLAIAEDVRILRIERRFWRLKAYRVRQMMLLAFMRCMRRLASPMLPKGVRIITPPKQDSANFSCGNPGCQAVTCYTRSSLKWEKAEWYKYEWVGQFCCPLCKHKMWVNVEQWDTAVAKTAAG